MTSLPMTYREYAAIPALASLIECVWTLDGDARALADAQPVLPDGRPEIVLHLGDAFDRLDERGVPERQPTMIFAGQLLRPLDLRATGRVDVVGIRLKPHAAAALFAEPQHRLVGQTVGIDALSPALGRVFDEARDRVHCGGHRSHTVQSLLTDLVDLNRIDPQVSAAVDRIAGTRGRVTVDALASHVSMTTRHLERRFRDVVGISPKRLARITRFQRALRLFEQLDSPQRGAETAATCGYADQAHFIRDFAEFGGCAPGAHLLRRAELNGFFVSGARVRC